MTSRGRIGIAVAFAMAFAVRYTMLEAFSIPLSALGPAVQGRHFSAACDGCGKELVEADLGQDVPKNLNCRDCGGRGPVRGGRQGGDRILVDKLSSPRRWDLILFHTPDPEPDWPVKKSLSRVVGLPGEAVELAVGDVFINGQRLVKPADQLDHLWLPVSDTARLKAGAPWGCWAREVLPDGVVLRYSPKISAPLITAVNTDTGVIAAAPRPVRDVRIDVELPPQHTGSVELSWSYGDLQAVVQFARETSTVTVRASERSQSASAACKATAGLAVRDGVVSALIDGRVVAACDLESRASADFAGKELPLDAFCGIAVKAALPPSRIRVWRDVHYFADGSIPDPAVRAKAGEPFRLGPNCFFVLADESGMGADSRTVTELDPAYQAEGQVGAVSRQMLVGVARWIYWPPTRAATLP